MKWEPLFENPQTPISVHFATGYAQSDRLAFSAVPSMLLVDTNRLSWAQTQLSHGHRVLIDAGRHQSEAEMPPKNCLRQV